MKQEFQVNKISMRMNQGIAMNQGISCIDKNTRASYLVAKSIKQNAANDPFSYFYI